MNNKLELYRVIPKYIDALKYDTENGDQRVYDVRGKENRPFVVIITLGNGQKYCIPLTKHKPKFDTMHDCIDFSRIISNGKIIGAVEFSRMIPLEYGQLRPLEMDFVKRDNKFYKNTKTDRQITYNWVCEHEDEIINKANILYNTYVSGQKFKRRSDCLNFPLIHQIK